MLRARARVSLHRCRCSPLCISMGYRLLLLALLALALPAAWNLAFGRVPHVRAIRQLGKTNMRGERIYEGNHSRGVVADPAALARAAIVVLARDEDCEGVLRSMARMEQRFNHKFRYPYVFLNNGPFSSEFKSRTTDKSSGRTLYAEIPVEHWSYPSWIDPHEAEQARKDMVKSGVLYGGRESYHHMCRYFSGFFFRHPVLADFDYYWRMEPDVYYYCDLDYDPFLFMQENGIKYGFTITVPELPRTIPTLWPAVQEYRKQHAASLPADNMMPFVTDAQGGYNLCHFWSNFELGDLRFFRSRPYLDFFDWLDRQGGFFLERWGDAPVHSLAAALLLNASQVHWFQDIGYRHNSMQHCPATRRNNCDCDAINAVDFHRPSFGRCHQRWAEFTGTTPHKVKS